MLTEDLKHPMRNTQQFYDGKHTLAGLSPNNSSNSGGSDLDWIVERHNKFFILELKHKNTTQIPLGQQILLQHLQDKLGKDSQIKFVFHGDDFDATNHGQWVHVYSLDEILRANGLVNLDSRHRITIGILRNILDDWWNKA